jgi:hypothetical protein
VGVSLETDERTRDEPAFVKSSLGLVGFSPCFMFFFLLLSQESGETKRARGVFNGELLIAQILEYIW